MGMQLEAEAKVYVKMWCTDFQTQFRKLVETQVLKAEKIWYEVRILFWMLAFITLSITGYLR